ncbi:DNA-binding transcriptional regulator, MarR family [Sinosporangium album]|uniref:DNA-binding transcriptional regulator, MarR family n=1 Tax=Sinosporangium album TaxID=504805 RepID=A0A1G8B709_9ACTN|nr:MarR family transcriptional regulator [Sinosporangium album]SDH28914.1 DNA-binding transcriptional regulator, MarR family [Sinosporangium album]
MRPLPKHLSDSEYARLLGLRAALRRFLRWSEEQAAEVGLTAAQHQLLLAIRGHSDPRGPTIGDLAEYLCTRHHSTVQLVNRVEQMGLVTRNRSLSGDRRIVRLMLTEKGEGKLALLSAPHLEELRRLAPLVAGLAESAMAPALEGAT